jgi:hypothetical protein
MYTKLYFDFNFFVYSKLQIKTCLYPIYLYISNEPVFSTVVKRYFIMRGEAGEDKQDYFQLLNRLPRHPVTNRFHGSPFIPQRTNSPFPCNILTAANQTTLFGSVGEVS